MQQRPRMHLRRLARKSLWPQGSGAAASRQRSRVLPFIAPSKNRIRCDSSAWVLSAVQARSERVHLLTTLRVMLDGYLTLRQSVIDSTFDKHTHEQSHTRDACQKAPQGNHWTLGHHDFLCGFEKSFPGRFSSRFILFAKNWGNLVYGYIDITEWITRTC